MYSFKTLVDINSFCNNIMYAFNILITEYILLIVTYNVHIQSKFNKCVRMVEIIKAVGSHSTKQLPREKGIMAVRPEVRKSSALTLKNLGVDDSPPL